MTLPDTREKLLCAAGDAFTEQGYRCCVDEIARRAGVAKQTLYHHFSGKDELFAEVIQRMAGEILVALGPVGERPVRESLLRYKFGGATGYAKVYGRLVAETVRTELPGAYDIVTWVPVSRKLTLARASAGRTVLKPSPV